jgi:putative sterol carrier protein
VAWIGIAFAEKKLYNCKQPVDTYTPIQQEEIMAIFKDRETAEKLFLEFWKELIRDNGLGDEFKKNEISIRFEINDLDLVMYVDENGPVFGDEAKEKKSVVTMKMSSDMVHKYWLDKVNIPMALAMRQIKAKGPVNKVLQILPMFKPGQKIYPEYCKKFDLPLEI